MTMRMTHRIVLTGGEELQLLVAADDLAARIAGVRLPLGWRIHRALVRALRRLRRAVAGRWS